MEINPLWEQTQRTTPDLDDVNCNSVTIDYSELDHENNIEETSSESCTSDYEEIEYYREYYHYLSKVCHKQPLLVEHHCTFVVDVSSLAAQKDIKCDDMGAYVAQ